jgi:hypothetical protein
MFGLVLSALRARRPQAVALFALTVLAALGAAAAPWFLAWAKDTVADAGIAAAPAEQRVVNSSGSMRYELLEGQLPTEVLRDRVAQMVEIPGTTPIAGARIYVNMVPVDGTPGGASGLYLAYRDDVCAQLRIEGRCPQAEGEVIIGRSGAEALGVTVGEEVEFSGFRLPNPVRLRVSGVYEVGDVLGPYWAGTDLLAGPTGLVSAIIDDPAFVTESTLLATQPDGLDMDLQVVLPPEVYHSAQFDLLGAINQATTELRTISFDLETQSTRLVEQIRRDQRLVEIGITVAATQLVVLCWFALFLAVRHTSEERRPDIGLLKLRGSANWRVWALTAQQSAWPMVAGAVLGWALGFLGAAALARELGGLLTTVDTEPARTLRVSVLASAGACVGALVAAVVAEWRSLRSPVVGLLRRVPARHRGWRAEVVDLVVVLLAAVGVYQGRAEATSGSGPSTLALLAPALVGLAVALLIARTLPWLAGAVGGSALRAGRAGAALAALHLARRPGGHRLFAVLAVAVSVLATSLVFWHAATDAWSRRADQAVGADRVLTVRAENSAALLAAVRSVDPAGTYAMAAARTFGPTSEDRVLAADTSRLLAVAKFSDEYRLGDASRLPGLLHPPAPEPLMVADGPVTLDLAGPVDLGPGLPMSLRLNLADGLGQARAADVGPLTPDRRAYETTVAGCPQPCRLVSIELVAPSRIKQGQPGTVAVYAIGQGDREVVPRAVLGDVTRWRSQVGSVGIGPLLRAEDGVLSLALHDGTVPPDQRVDARTFVVDAPAPLPVVLAGARPEARRSGDERVTLLGTERVPFHVVATAAVLPRLGDVGVLADLEYAQRLMGRAGEAAALEVWLTDDAPSDIVSRLEAQGVVVLREEAAAAAYARLAGQGPGLALRFELFAAGIMLLLAAGTLAVTAAVERRPRIEELTWMRIQGLGVRPTRTAARAGTAALVGTGILTGVAAAVLAAGIVTAAMPTFADDWRLLPLLSGPQPGPLLVAIVASTTVLGAVALLGARRVARGVDTRRFNEDRPA